MIPTEVALRIEPTLRWFTMILLVLSCLAVFARGIHITYTIIKKWNNTQFLFLIYLVMTLIASIARFFNVYLFPPGKPAILVVYAWAVYWTVVSINVDTICHDRDPAIAQIICCANTLY
jgi:uncharacterized membrane protein